MEERFNTGYGTFITTERETISIHKKRCILRHVRNLSIAIFILSLLGVMFGVIMASRSRQFPYMLAPPAGLASAVLVLMARNHFGREASSKLNFLGEFFSVVFGFAGICLWAVLGVGGVWVLIDCIRLKLGRVYVKEALTAGDVNVNIVLSAISLAISLVMCLLTALFVSLFLYGHMTFGKNSNHISRQGQPVVLLTSFNNYASTYVANSQTGGFVQIVNPSLTSHTDHVLL
ncbi:hypothetical protein MAR_009850 [Mya arenaria]|uniref:Uncharacterized protein n=1 Tax=Mya arenaria TaxID=6604 RepID=A0ABY7DZX2_MYAAR|nr:hypothetical protein MAR_009850 [Mya arenaria]